MRYLAPNTCGGCGDTFDRCTCDAMGIPAPASEPMSLERFIAQLLGRPLSAHELAAVERYQRSQPRPPLEGPHR